MKTLELIPNTVYCNVYGNSFGDQNIDFVECTAGTEDNDYEYTEQIILQLSYPEGEWIGVDHQSMLKIYKQHLNLI